MPLPTIEIENVVIESSELLDEYTQDVSLDKYNLDSHWEEQATIFKKWADRSAYAYAYMLEKKEEVARKYSELDSYIRDPLNWGEHFPDHKMTEAAITNYIKSNEEYQTTVDEYIEATRISKMREQDKEGVMTNKDAIEGLTRLHGQSYFAKPYVPKTAREEVENTTRDTLVQNLNTTTRRRRALPEGKQ